MKKVLPVLSVLVGLLILAVLVFLSIRSGEEPTSDTISESADQAQEEQQAVEEELPDLNPAANTNPFGDVYKNPFE